MATNRIEIYLKDHLAGAGLGVELVSTLSTRFSQTPAGEVLAELHTELEAERAQLKNLMDSLGIEESSLRKTGAWLSEKLLEIKLKLEEGEGSFFLFEGLEALSVGIAGKHLLRVCLFELSKRADRFGKLDYPTLIAQALRQRATVERLRPEAAQKVFL